MSAKPWLRPSLDRLRMGVECGFAVGQNWVPSLVTLTSSVILGA